MAGQSESVDHVMIHVRVSVAARMLRVRRVRNKQTQERSNTSPSITISTSAAGSTPPYVREQWPHPFPPAAASNSPNSRPPCREIF